MKRVLIGGGTVVAVGTAAYALSLALTSTRTQTSVYSRPLQPASRPPPTFGPAPPPEPVVAQPAPRPGNLPPGQPNPVVAQGPPCLGISDPNVLSACLLEEGLTPAEWDRMVMEAQGGAGQQPPPTEPPPQGGVLGAIPGAGLAIGTIGQGYGFIGSGIKTSVGAAMPVVKEVPSFMNNAINDAISNPMDFSSRQFDHVQNVAGTAFGAGVASLKDVFTSNPVSVGKKAVSAGKSVGKKAVSAGKKVGRSITRSFGF